MLTSLPHSLCLAPSFAPSEYKRRIDNIEDTLRAIEKRGDTGAAVKERVRNLVKDRERLESKRVTVADALESLLEQSREESSAGMGCLCVSMSVCMCQSRTPHQRSYFRSAQFLQYPTRLDALCLWSQLCQLNGESYDRTWRGGGGGGG